MEIQESKRVPTARVHFGYTGGISMTTIRGGPERYKRDRQEPFDPWLFVLMHEVENYLVPEPRELGVNDSFAVFKMICDRRRWFREVVMAPALTMSAPSSPRSRFGRSCFEKGCRNRHLFRSHANLARDRPRQRCRLSWSH
jgi:hypothetical protein